jgi:complex iron-sulfur molybdoenzyme family reductase subunit gamma
MRNRTATALVAVIVVVSAGAAPMLVSARPANQIPFEDVGADSLADPEANNWSEVPDVTVPLSSAPSGLPNAQSTSAESVRVRAAHNASHMFVKLTWNDTTPDENVTGPRAFVDAAAVQVPVNTSSRPAIAMGSTRNAVNVWYWRADTGTEELLAGGAGTTTQFVDPAVQTRTVHEDGRWQVVYTRQLVTPGSNRTDVQQGVHDTSMAFAVWNGSEMERSGRKAVSSWYHLPTGPAPQGPPMAGILWGVAGIALLIVAVVTADAVRKHRVNPDGK